MNCKLKKTLKKIAPLLNKDNIIWGVGASVMLNYYKIVDKCNDIDIQVSLEDIERIDAILSKMGEKTKRLPNTTYKTKFFYEYIIDGIEVDVMAGLCVHRDGVDHSFNFTRESVGDIVDLEGIKIPMAKLNDWYNIYKVLPKREEKVKAIRKFLA